MAPNALAASPIPGARTTRTLVGNAAAANGVAGRTLTLECGLRLTAVPETELWRSEAEVLVGLAREADEVLEALECEWWWVGACGIERMLETELEVDFRPRRPALERR